MTYGLDRRFPDESPAAANTPVGASLAAWRRLDERTRLQLIERQLRPANDGIDGYPLAL